MSTILGLRGTGGWGDERPTNFREKILYLYPNSPAILTVLTGKLKTEATNDPQFTFFHKGLPVQEFKVNGEVADGEPTVVFDSTTGLKVGHMLYVPSTGEVIRITTITDGTSCETLREIGCAAGSWVIPDDEVLVVIGSAYNEGADTPEAISVTASTVANYTQIFRTALKLTGTMKATYLRTGEVEAELKREAAERHAIEMEYAFLFGAKYQSSDAGYGAAQILRSTGGLTEFVTTNVVDAGGTISISEWESFLESVFLIPGSKSEKLMLCGNKSLTALNAMARSYGEISLVPTSEAFGMKLSRWETPYGTLYLKGHPLLSQNTQFNDWGFVVDTSNIVYRPLKGRDTKFLKDRQSPGVDAIICEFLTEAGLEVRHEQTHGIIKNVTSFAP